MDNPLNVLHFSVLRAASDRSEDVPVGVFREDYEFCPPNPSIGA